jgi:uncharacterized protein YodC (DUF2158 family)
MSNDAKPCTACDGTGTVYEYGDPFDCGVCHSSGIEPVIFNVGDLVRVPDEPGTIRANQVQDLKDCYVTLASGGPRMLVVQFDEQMAKVQWRSVDGQEQHSSYPRVCLKLTGERLN